MGDETTTRLGDRDRWEDADPEAALVALLQEFRSLDNAPAPDPAFVRRLGAAVLRSPDEDRSTVDDAARCHVPNGIGTWSIVGERQVAVELLSGTPQALRRIRRAGRARHPLPSFGATATAAMLILVLASATWAFAYVAPSRSGRDAAYQLFRATNAEGSPRLVPIDPETLVDDPAAPAIVLNDLPISATPTAHDGQPEPIEAAEWYPSADGSTIVAVEAWDGGPATDRRTALVLGRDEATWEVRATLTLTASLGVLGLTDDGAFLVIGQPQPFRPDTAELVEFPRWEVVNTATGEEVAFSANDHGASIAARAGLIDSDRLRLYHLEVDQGSPADAPWPTTLRAYDLTTGQVVDELDLPDVRAGYWADDVDTEAGPAMVARAQFPGAALAPDGSVLVIVHGDGTTLTQVDPSRFVATGSVSLGGVATPAVWPVSDTLPQAPTPSPMLGTETPGRGPLLELPGLGYSTWITAGAVSNRFYVAGYVRGPDASGDWSGSELPLQAVDLRTGQVTGRLAGDGGIEEVTERSVYVWRRPLDPTDQSEPRTLLRLDPTTLETLAERTFPVGQERSRRIIVLIPAESSG